MAVPAFRDILTDTSTALRKDAAVLSPLAGLFLFLPLAVFLWLLLDSPMVRDAATLSEAQMQAQTTQFAEANGIWLFLLMLVIFWGQLIIAAFQLDPRRPTVGGALGYGLKLLLPYFAVTILIQLAVQLLAVLLASLGVVGSLILFGIALFVGLRIFLFIPALAVRRGGAIMSLRDSWRMTGGDFWKLFLPFLFGMMGATFIGMIALVLLTLPVGAFFGPEASSAATAILIALLMAVLMLYSLLFSFSAWRARQD